MVGCGKGMMILAVRAKVIELVAGVRRRRDVRLQCHELDGLIRNLS